MGWQKGGPTLPIEFSRISKEWPSDGLHKNGLQDWGRKRKRTEIARKAAKSRWGK
jgi:hypothetical protein